jgi:hypothetical protein
MSYGGTCYIQQLLIAQVFEESFFSFAACKLSAKSGCEEG